MARIDLYNKIHEQAPQDDRWLNEIHPDQFDPILLQPFDPKDMSRPPHVKKDVGGTAYIVVESNTGIPTKMEKIDHTCGAACGNCYLIYGGDTPNYLPPADEMLGMKQDLEGKGYDVIITGAEILTLPQEYWDAGIFDRKKYLLSAGLIPAYSPSMALNRIGKAGIRNVQMSLHGALDMQNQFGGVPKDVVERAITNIQKLNKKFGTFIGYGLNVTVGKHNLGRLSEIADYVLGDLNCNALRFNRHKAAGGRYPELMLEPDDHIAFYQEVMAIRQQYPKDTFGKLVSVSGDFGKLHRPGEYECPAGLPGGEITIVPKKDGQHAVYSCLEVRQPDMQMGRYSAGELVINTAPFEQLKDQTVREELGMGPENDGCLAYETTRPTSTAAAIRKHLTQGLQNRAV